MSINGSYSEHLLLTASLFNGELV